MIGSLRNLIFGGAAEEAVAAGAHGSHALHHAAAGLLVEMALLDDHFDAAERSRIEALLAREFELPATEIAEIIAAAEAAAAENVELYTLSRTLRDHFDLAERVGMIEMLWEVAYADGVLDDYESNMLRRMTGLLYVTDRESGEARKRVLARREGEAE